MRLAIADPPYPPALAVRRDRPGGPLRMTTRSRARRWYGDGTRSATDSPPADFHPDAGDWDDPARHHELLEHLMDEYDGWALATCVEGLDIYRPLPIPAHVMAWVKPGAIPGGHRLLASWEPVLVGVPEGRTSRRNGMVKDVLIAPSPGIGFAGAKPAAWTDWVLDALGFDPLEDTVDDLFPGSGSVAAAVAARTAASAAPTHEQLVIA